MKIKEDNNNLFVGNNNIFSANNPLGNSITNLETPSVNSAFKVPANVDPEEKKEKTASNIGINDLALTPSGLLLTLINPNPGNIKEGSFRNLPTKRKRSGSNSNLNSLSTAGPNIIYNKYSSLQGDELL